MKPFTFEKKETSCIANVHSINFSNIFLSINFQKGAITLSRALIAKYNLTDRMFLSLIHNDKEFCLKFTRNKTEDSLPIKKFGIILGILSIDFAKILKKHFFIHNNGYEAIRLYTKEVNYNIIQLVK